MAERLDLTSEIDYSELSRKIEQAWRVVTRPQNYSEFEVEGADHFLDEIRMRILNTVHFDFDDRVSKKGEGLMLGLYHYIGPVFCSRSDDDINLS